ncbi:DNA gyrase subunit A [Candidatus Woesearchaeota archaeon]|nr:DNA gyrase subunit A [Candidatus Woesearchaeota archaeon]
MAEKIKQVLIEEEMKNSYIDYAMSVITARALPDVNDGLKPVHRRILYAMHKAGLQHNKPFRKCARVVGDVLGRYHPHGDMAVYDSLVRMAQDFSLRYPLIKGQGNFGSIEGYSAASMRYTECKLTPIAEEMLNDIDKDTVKFIPNYDESYKEPIVLPGKFPNLLVNGTTGIAVGMTSSIPPHNLREIADAIIAMIDNSEIKTEELMQFVKGPDFPTAATIIGNGGIRKTYKTGRGRVKVRAKCEFEDKKIIISEIPYMVNKTSLIESMAELVKSKRVEGIKDIRDESDRKGMRIVIMLKDSANKEVVLNQLYKHTQLQTTFSIIMTSLVAGQPKTMSLKHLISFFIQHRKRTVIRRTEFELKKSEDRVHILEGLRIALKNIDNVVKDIKESKDVETAKALLIEKYKLSEKQSLAILDMRLQRLTGLEQTKLQEEYNGLLDIIKDLKDLLNSEPRIFGVIKSETLELKEKYGDDRRTVIMDGEEEDIEDESLIENEAVIITATRDGYIKQTLLEDYRQQKRGGTGIIATEKKEEDIVEHLFSTKTHSYLLFFTNIGRVCWLKVYNIPRGSRYSKGKAIVNLLKLEEGEKVNAILPISDLSRESYIMFATKKGKVKKTPLKSFSKPRKIGIKAIKLEDKDEVVAVKLTPGNLGIIVGSKLGNAVKFNEVDVRVMGRNASGVRGIRLKEKDEVVGMEIANPEATLLTVTEKGFGKRTDMNEYRLTRRGGKGVRNIKITDKNGNVVGIKTVKDEDEAMFITQNGVVIRTTVNGISKIGRSTQGVRLIKLREGDKVKTVTRIISRI